MASALSTFSDFVATTGPAYLTSAEDVVNEAVKNNYLLRRFIRGKGPEEIIQGGATIKDTIMFDEDSTFQYYQPNETFTWQNPQVLTSWEINWRFSVDHMSYTDQEIELNITSGMTKGARHQMYKKLKRSKEQRMWTSCFNGMEDALFAVPEVADQETATGLKPYSIPAFINESTNGLFYGTNSTPTGKTAWSTVEGINPVTYSKWVPQQGQYGSVSPTASGATAALTNLFSAFDKMFLDVQFVPPPTMQEYFDNPSLNAMFVACSKAGVRVYQNMLRVAQDTFVSASRQDPSYMSPKISGIDLVYVPSLDTAKLYEAETDTNPFTTELDGGGGATKVEDSGPRYFFINANYIKPVFHTSRYMYKHDPMRHPNQPFTTIVPVDCWHNLVCRSRQRQGIVYPSGDVVV